MFKREQKPTSRRAWDEVRDYTQREIHAREALVGALKEVVVQELLKLKVCASSVFKSAGIVLTSAEGGTNANSKWAEGKYEASQRGEQHNLASNHKQKLIRILDVRGAR